MSVEIRCPHCGNALAWAPQPVDVIVRCPMREITGLLRGRPQRWPAVYAEGADGNGARCWVEYYRVDAPDVEPRWRCGGWFRVRAAA